jgi:UDP-glucose 4-epimerase
MSGQKTILITGGAGYIGSHTIIELIENTGFNVISVDNFSNSSAKTFERIKQITGKKIQNYSIDLCDKTALENVFEKEPNIAGIIHFAAFKSVPESVSNPYKYYHNNINSLLNILECCLKYSVDNFIFSSSCSVYGNINNLPVSENTPFGKAESPYAYTKQVGEEIMKDYTRAYQKLQCIALRYFNPVGAHLSGLIGEDPINPATNLVPVITETAIGKRNSMRVFGNDYNTRDGSCIRDYIHVTDIAIAHIKAMEFIINKKQNNNYSVFNLGTGTGVSVFEAITAFEKISKLKLNYTIAPKREGDVSAIYSNTELTEKTLHWKPEFSLEEMMESAWKWQLHQQKETTL